jgi:hypothetical protein
MLQAHSLNGIRKDARIQAVLRDEYFLTARRQTSERAMVINVSRSILGVLDRAEVS